MAISRRIPLRRIDRRLLKSPFLAAISASSRSASASSRMVGAPLAAAFAPSEGCEVARREAVLAAAVVGLADFERAWGTCGPPRITRVRFRAADSTRARTCLQLTGY